MIFKPVKYNYFTFFFLQGSTAVPRNAYPNISQSVSATIKGPQRMMSSPAASNIAPYRGTNWTQHGYSNAQQAYRYTSPLPQPAYATFATSQQATPVCVVCDFIYFNRKCAYHNSFYVLFYPIWGFMTLKTD